MKISEETLMKMYTQSGLGQLSLRERMALTAGVIFVAGFLLFQFAVAPYLESRKQLASSIRRGKNDLAEIQLLQKEYGELRKQEGGIKAHLAKRSGDFTLFTFLDKQASLAGVKEQIVYMKPSVVEGDGEFSESVVEIKLKEVDLKHLVQLMNLIESEKNVVSIRRISIQKSVKVQGELDAILQVVTFVEAGE